MKHFINRALVAKKHLKLFFALFAMLALGVGNAWSAEKSFTINFKDNGSDSSTALTTSTFKNQVSESADSIKSVVSTANCYAGTGGLKSSSNKNNGSFTLQLNNQLSITKIVLNVKNKNATTKTVNVGNTSFNTTDDWNTTSFTDLLFTGAETKSDQLTISLAGTVNSKRVAYLSSITIYHNVAESDGGDEDPTPTKLTAPANLKEASIAETSATLSWDAVANASNYSVTINGNNATATTNSYNATGLTAGTEYTWSVVANGDGTNYTDSDVAQHTFTTASPTPDPEPGSGTSGGDKYTKVTTLDDLEDGAYYVLYGVNDSYTGALKNTVSSGRAGLQAVTITEDAITNPDAAIVWRLNGNSSDGWTLYNEKESKYIEITTSSTSGFSLNESSSHTYTVTVSSEKGFFFKSNHTDADSRGISIYQTDFRPYASSAAKILYLFKKATETGGDEPGTGEPVASLTAK